MKYLFKYISGANNLFCKEGDGKDIHTKGAEVAG